MFHFYRNRRLDDRRYKIEKLGFAPNRGGYHLVSFGFMYDGESHMWDIAMRHRNYCEQREPSFRFELVRSGSETCLANIKREGK